MRRQGAGDGLFVLRAAVQPCRQPVDLRDPRIDIGEVGRWHVEVGVRA